MTTIADVCLDAGHYGKYNQSPADKSYYESEKMWELHLLQKQYLEAGGLTVITTRADQKKDLDLKSRGLAAKGCKVFISNHTNSTAAGTINAAIDFVTVYCQYDDSTTEIDELSRELANMLAPEIAELMDVNQGFVVTSRKSSNDRNGDGYMNDNYHGVLNGARIAEVIGVIIEHSFHTNPRTVAWLKDEKNLQALAKLEARIVINFIKSKFGVEVEESTAPTYYRVQAGAYNEPRYAEAKKRQLIADGFSAIVKWVDSHYKVQVGAYEVKANAEKCVAKLKAKGYDAFITTGK